MMANTLRPIASSRSWKRAVRGAWIAAALCAFTLTSSAVSLRTGGPSEDMRRGPTFRLFFPRINLDRRGGERVTHLYVKVECGEFGGVRSIPADWYMSTERSGSVESVLEAYAGHGATYLWSLREWSGSIEVSIIEPECFTVSAIVKTSGDGDTPREIRLSRTQLKLRK